MRKIIFPTLIILLIFPDLFAQDNIAWNKQSYKNFSINYPTDKSFVENDPSGEFTIYLLPSLYPERSDNIMMEIHDIAGYMLDLDSYSLQFYDAYFRYANITIIEDKIININNQPCHKFIIKKDDGHGEVQYVTMVHIWVKNNWAYNLIFSAKPDKYEELKPIAQKVIDSFKFKD
jgi:hypothetical protein